MFVLKSQSSFLFINLKVTWLLDTNVSNIIWSSSFYLICVNVLRAQKFTHSTTTHTLTAENSNVAKTFSHG